MTDIGSLDGRFRPWVAALLHEAQRRNLAPIVTSARRSRTKQAALYREYLRKRERGIPTLPAAPPGRSLHERGLAVDIVSRDPALLGRVWRSWGGRWYESDPVHYEAG